MGLSSYFLPSSYLTWSELYPSSLFALSRNVKTLQQNFEKVTLFYRYHCYVVLNTRLTRYYVLFRMLLWVARLLLLFLPFFVEVNWELRSVFWLTNTGTQRNEVFFQLLDKLQTIRTLKFLNCFKRVNKTVQKKFLTHVLFVCKILWKKTRNEFKFVLQNVLFEVVNGFRDFV